MPRVRPRLSLLTALLLTTIVGLAIVVAQLWREVEPLRIDVRRLRTEVGNLTVEDPAKACIIAVPTSEVDTWRWRVYLPPGNQYELCEYSGHLPKPSPHGDNSWYDAVRKDGVGSSSISTALSGEITIESKIFKRDGTWLLQTSATKRDDTTSTKSGGTTSIYQPSGDWLSDRRARSSTSDASLTDQLSLEVEQPILLLHLKRPIINDLPGGGHTSTMPTDSADGIVIWLEPKLSVAIPAAVSP